MFFINNPGQEEKEERGNLYSINLGMGVDVLHKQSRAGGGGKRKPLVRTD